jgi:hypothetical protein
MEYAAISTSFPSAIALPAVPVEADRRDVDHVRNHACILARRHRLSAKTSRDRLLGRIRQTSGVFHAAHRRLGRSTGARTGPTSAACWLRENMGWLEEQCRTVRRLLPRNAHRDLPQLAGAQGQSRPRVYELARELVVHLDGQRDRETVRQFVGAYQSISPLKLAELWALPGMLRLVLLEGLSGPVIHISRQHHDQQVLPSPIDGDNGTQGQEELAIIRGITSLREMGSWDWREFVEKQSAVDRALREDPAGVYAKMTFSSRDHYRQIVEKLARRSPLGEAQVAQAAIAHARGACASAAKARSADRREMVARHVGYYLVDRGRAALEQRIGYRRTWQDILGRGQFPARLGWYVGTIAIVWLLCVAGAGAAAASQAVWPAAGTLTCLLLVALFAAAAGQFAIPLVNWLCARMAPPRPMLRLDFSAGIPADARTLVAVPVLLTSAAAVRDLVEKLELRFLANRDENLWFALLTDFPDAAQETLPGDGPLLTLARAQVEQLNQRYCRGRPPIFYLLHRPRRWNRQQGVWMAEERKRGKLASLNRLIRTGTADAFSDTVGDLAQLASVRFVITLDADTRLPRDTGRELAGCLAHPLNRPRIDPRSRRVAGGYAVLQPRVGTTIPDAYRSPFTRLFAGESGIDPYTRQTSDVYHDLFAEGSFIGKGIYDVGAFTAALEGRFPDNRVLSHDLIEGCFARSGLVNDVELFEGLPGSLLAELSRRHRWIRGDWQIAAWLGRKVPTASGSQGNPLSGLSRWKIFDNLRRSLSPLFLLSFLVLGWVAAPAWAGLWTVLALAISFGPPLVQWLPGLLQKCQDTPWRLHFAGQGRRCLRTCLAEALSWSFLPHTVRVQADAVLRTLYRLYVSHRGLLEWTTASEAESQCQRSLCAHYRVMWVCPLGSVVLAALLALTMPHALWFAGPLLAAWLAGPLVAWRISQPYRAEAVRMTGTQQRQLRRWARQTWHYFETFVGELGNWLPPDHVQEGPGKVVACRTSPTNIGMDLLARLGAYDLGYLPAAALLEHVGHTLRSMLRLERYRGHLYNWYDTRTLQPIEPRYVSSVDSGNLWGALVVLGVGLEELRHRPLLSPRLAEGLHDTLEVIATLRASSCKAAPDDVFDMRLADLRRECSVAFHGGMRLACEELCRIRARAADLAARAAPDQAPLREWTRALVRQCSRAHQDLSRWVFWACAPEHRSMPAPLAAWLDLLDAGCTLSDLLQTSEQVDETIGRLVPTTTEDGHTSEAAAAALGNTLRSLRESARRAAAAARAQLQQITALAALCRRFGELDFQFLFDRQRKLLAVGYRVDDRCLDNAHYDLLASEARLASFLAVSHGQLPLEHWFSLGRPVTLADGRPTLLSWSGSMFEYLMPLLFTPCYPGTLLEASCRAAVRRQIRYARRHGVPWGISESSHLDGDGGYGYRSFGVPGLGLMRGLGAHLVIAPYASALALMIAPHKAYANLVRLERLGGFCPYGCYDAIEYRSQHRLPAIVPHPCRLVMTHHAGMTFLALVNTLLDKRLLQRFLKNPACAAHDVLLQERVPQNLAPVGPGLLDTSPWHPAADGDSR